MLAADVEGLPLLLMRLWSGCHFCWALAPEAEADRLAFALWFTLALRLALTFWLMVVFLLTFTLLLTLTFTLPLP